MSTSTRTHEDEAQVEPWWGTLQDVVAALRRAEQILADRDPEASVGSYISVDHGRTNDLFSNNGDIAAAVASGALDATRVDKVYARYSSRPKDDAIAVWFTYGAGVTVTSSDEVWLEGALRVMEEHLAAHRQPERQPGWGPITTGHKLAAVLFVFMLAAVIAVAVAADYSLIGYVANVVVWLVATAAVAPLLFGDVWHPRTDSLRFLPADLPPTPEKREGLIAKVERFIRARPLLNLGLTFLFGIAVTKVSDML